MRARTILIGAAAVILLMLLFPPYYAYGKDGQRTTDVGYHSVLVEHRETQWEMLERLFPDSGSGRPSGRELSRPQLERLRRNQLLLLQERNKRANKPLETRLAKPWRIDTNLQLTQWVGVAMMAAILSFAFKDRTDDEGEP